MKKSTMLRLTASLIIALPWVVGCGETTTENLSTNAAADPAKLKQAQEELDAAAAKSKTAEAAKTKGAINVEER